MTYRRLHAAAWTVGQVLRRRPERGIRRELEASQYFDRGALAALQWRNLERLLAHAYERVPFYRARMDAAGLPPNAIRSWDDFARLPELTREEVRTRLPELLSTRLEPGVRKTVTSGSTGIPLEFFQDERYLVHRRAARARAQRWYGYERGDKVAMLSGSERDVPQRSWRDRFFAVLERQRWVSAFDMSEERLDTFARGLAEWRPDFIAGYASALHTMAQYAMRHSIVIRPRVVQSMAEQVWDFQRADIEQAFGCPLIDFYGARESAPIAAQCLERDGLHVMADLRVVEILDAAGRPAAPGEVGRVVVTDLTNYAMPLIRYANDDLASWGVDSPCRCGRTLPRLASLHGRSSDVITSKDGTRIHGYYFMFLFYGAKGVEQFQVRQTSLESIEVLIKPAPDYREEFAREIMRKIDQRTGGAFRVSCRLVDDIPLTPAGKRRFILSDVA